MTDAKTHWQRVYQEKSPGEVSWYQKAPTLSLQLIEHTGLARTAAIIDVGGGASTLVDYLLERQYSHLTVLDISGLALSHAQRRLGQRAKTIDWIEADVTTFSAPASFDLWHDRAVFHFLTAEADRQAYVSALKRSLKPHGHLIMAAFAIGGPQKCSGLEIVQYDANTLMAVLGPEFELVEEAEELHLTPNNKEQQFGYFRFIYHPAGV